jgi:glycosyltransferase involved in cell wall biosynthesis
LNSAPKGRVAHIIGDLNGFGGTENTLLRYLLTTKSDTSQHLIIVLRSAGTGNTIGAQIIAAGFEVTELHQSKGKMSLAAILAARRRLKEFDPSAISAWLYHPILISFFIGMGLGAKARQYWHIRSLPFTPTTTHARRQFVVKIAGWLTRVSHARLLTNSNASQAAHLQLGYRAHNWRVIANGIDINQYIRTDAIIDSVRGELHLPVDAIVIATVGRLSPEKGYGIFFEALKHLKTLIPQSAFDRIYWIGAGHNISPVNQEIQQGVAGTLPPERQRLLDKRSDVPQLLSVANFFVLSSISESFPNVLIEAMASGAFPIASSVGGVNELDLPASCLFPPGASDVLAEKLADAIRMPEPLRQETTRRNFLVVSNGYSIGSMTAAFDAEFFLEARHG